MSGAVLWEGSSLLDGSPVVVVATGLSRSKSSNRKTGRMVQTWILRADVDPVTAVAIGRDTAVCGDCRHRSVASGGLGSCYVNTGQAPLAVWEAWTRGRYAILPDPWSIAATMAGRRVRIGSYGDPGAVPAWVWKAYTRSSSGWTGYTHQWRRSPELRGLCMASVDSEREALEAQALGWRTFRVGVRGVDARLRAEARCPASREAGFKRTCSSCPIRCSGGQGLSVVIQAHGSRAGRIVA